MKNNIERILKLKDSSSMDAPIEPVESNKSPLTVIFRDVPEYITEDLSNVLLNNADARRAVLLFLQDSGLLLAPEGTVWDVLDVQIKLPEKPL